MHRHTTRRGAGGMSAGRRRPAWARAAAPALILAGLAPAPCLSAGLSSGFGPAPAAAESTPEGTRVLGVRAGSACLRERVRITGFALPREESGATVPFDGYRVTDILVAEGDAVTAGQDLLKAVRQPSLDPSARPTGPDAYTARAPIAGRVTRLNARVGQVTGAAPSVPMGQPPATPPAQPEPMVRIAGEGGTDLLVDVPSPYAAKIRAGLAARIVPDDGPELAGTVRVPAAEVDPQTQLGRARLTVEPAGGLRPGQFASAVIETARDCALAVPRAAVSYRNGVPTVQVLNGTRVETRSVRTGLSDGTTVHIRDGLADDEAVVADAGTALRAGDRVTPVITGKVGGR